MTMHRKLTLPTRIEADVSREVNLRAASSAVPKFAETAASYAVCVAVRRCGRILYSRSSSETGVRKHE